MHRGTPTWREQVLGGLALAGPDAVLTGSSALKLSGFAHGSAGRQVHILIPADRRRQSHGSALLERTRRLPPPVRRGTLPTAPLARAVIDACRRIEDVAEVREIVAEALQTHRVPLRRLAEEVRAAARQRTAAMRQVLAELAAGVRSAAEAQARAVVVERGLPEPLWNAELVSPEGEVIARPDALWLQWLAVMEINSRRWHLSPRDFEYTHKPAGTAGSPRHPRHAGDAGTDPRG